MTAAGMTAPGGSVVGPMGRWSALVLALGSLAGCACDDADSARSEAVAVAEAVADAGPPMLPIGPRDAKPDPPPPACDPEWRELEPQPPATAASMSDGAVAVGTRLALVGWGFAAVGGPDGWSHVDATRMPEIEVGPGRRTVFAHAVEHDGDVFVVGSRMKILRFDGDAWHLEHRDAGVSPRRTAHPRIGACDGRLQAHAIGITLERQTDGRWRDIDRDDACDWRGAPTPRPDERCGNHQPWMDTVQCAAGFRVWSPARERWLAIPDEHATPTLWHTLFENRSGAYLLAGEVLLHSPDGTRWGPVDLGGDPIRSVASSDERVFAVAGDRVWVRDVCEPASGG